MSGVQQDAAVIAGSFPLNGTAALGRHDQMNSARLEFKVFDFVIISLAFCILIITGVYCITVCYNRSRQSKRAQVYEGAVTRSESPDPVAVKAVKRSTSFINPLAFFRKPEAAKDNPRIYYIYSNPLPVGLKEEEEEEEVGNKALGEQTAPSLPPSLQEHGNDPKNAVTLEPLIFCMQL